ncbi:MAG: DNA mismatch repair endonuclease MutL [Limnochordaceae bacterium]|nr:DNA mismatch repair endonuclease MutL [Limnochordaceae bacterium]
MSTIQALPAEVVEKIAAGEVIENPAAVVKELVENSLDAGAQRITVEIRGAGKELIQVTDDGAGIPAGELPLAVASHATSKLRSLADLQHITTLGFRGEALASIAAVSRLQITSRPPTASQASTLSVHGGRVSPAGVQPAGAPTGTTVRVEELFFNTPARYRFLRQDPAERRAIVQVVAQLALVHPQVHFRLVAEGEEVLSTPGDGSLLNAARAVWGDAVAEQLLPLPADAGAGWALDGLIAAPGLDRAHRQDEVLALNGRVVEVRSLRVAIEKAYESQLPPRRFPVAVVRMQIDPALVDVNVHPTKREVRLQEESVLFRAVRYACVRTLQEWAGAGPRFQLNVGGPLSDTLSPGVPGQSRAESAETPGEYNPGSPTGQGVPIPSTPAQLRPGSGPPEAGITSPQLSETAPAEAAYGKALQELRVIGQLHQAFIVGETPAALWLIDQHIAHERVLFEALQDEYQKARVSGKPAPSQELLLPAPVRLPVTSLPADDAAIWGELRELGFVCEPFGPARVVVRAVPLAWGRLGRELAQPGQVEAAISEILAAWMQEGATAGGHAGVSDRLYRTWATLSCKAAIKAGEYLTPAQMEQVVRQLALCRNPYTCPHGRPIVLRIGRDELLRSFGRPVRPAM